MSEQAVIQTHELTKHYQHPLFFWHKRAYALNGLTIDVEPGEVYGLLGPNGSGKSTTIKLILGMLWPSAGQVSVFGRHPNDLRVKERTGYLPEESHLYRFLTAEETLDFYGRLFHLPRAERRRRTAALLEMTGLTMERNRPVSEFSKGMQRRIGLAQALINDPDLVILDEPTSGMDPLGTREIKNLILDLKDKRKTVLLSSHLLSDVEDVCDRVAILYGGKVRAQGAVADLLSDEKRTQVTAEMDEDTLMEVTDLLRERLGEDAEIDVEPPMERLENFFIRVVNDAEREGAFTSGASRQNSAAVDFFTEASGEDMLESLAAPRAAASARQAAAVEPVIAENRDVLNQLAGGAAGAAGVSAAGGLAAQPGQQAPVAPLPPEKPDEDLLGKLSGK